MTKEYVEILPYHYDGRVMPCNKFLNNQGSTKELLP